MRTRCFLANFFAFSPIFEWSPLESLGTARVIAFFSGLAKNRGIGALIMHLETLSVDTSGHVATITLNRPEKRNAISIRMICDLHTALDSIEKTRTRVLVITGTR